jgi:hypothetical protein
MSSFAPIAPVECLLEMKKANMLGGYLLLLAHEVVQNERKYKELLEGFNGTIIMDNSLIELGKPVSGDIMFRALEVTNANYAVLPDKLFGCAETIEASTTAARQWRYAGVTADFMIVAQGNNVMERVECVREISRKAGINEIFVGIPRAIVKTEGSRIPTVTALRTQLNANIHLLGFSANYYDDIVCARLHHIMGIDSATPIRLGWEHKKICSPMSEWAASEDVELPREEFFKQCNKFTYQMAYNVGAVAAAIDAE